MIHPLMMVLLKRIKWFCWATERWARRPLQWGSQTTALESSTSRPWGWTFSGEYTFGLAIKMKMKMKKNGLFCQGWKISSRPTCHCGLRFLCPILFSIAISWYIKLFAHRRSERECERRCDGELVHLGHWWAKSWREDGRQLHLWRRGGAPLLRHYQRPDVCRSWGLVLLPLWLLLLLLWFTDLDVWARTRIAQWKNSFNRFY